MFWLALGILGLGALIKGIGDVQQAQAKAREDERKAAQLEELSKPGGYYDQEIAAIQADLQDVEADRQAAGKMLALTALDIAQQERQVTRQGAQITGGIAAGAGAGNLAQTGSIEVRKETIERQVRENIGSLERTMERNRIQYEDQLRGLATRQAQDTALQTKAEFQKTSGLSDAEALRSEADWLNTWGVGLSIVSGITGFVSGAIGLGGQGLGAKSTPLGGGFATATGTAYGSPYASGLAGVDWNSEWARMY